MPIAGIRLSASTRTPRPCSDGISIRAGVGMAFTATRSWSCWPTAFWSGSNGSSARSGATRGVALFPPRPDRRRQSLAAIHRHVLDWLRLLAIDQLIREGRLDDYRPDKEVTK